MSTKPILFNTDMVRGLLADRKTVTRRLCRITVNGDMTVAHKCCSMVRFPEEDKDGLCAQFYDKNNFYQGRAKPPYHPGDILYVRETWRNQPLKWSPEDGYSDFILQYRADLTDEENDCYGRRGGTAPLRWCPSIHMPREAARIFLRVTNVRAERLQDITSEGIEREGIDLTDLQGIGCITRKEYVCAFQSLWDSTIKPADRALYGWDANPWVWVIGFERISREEVHL